jgi:RNA polymerase sigma-70 factor (family 1)
MIIAADDRNLLNAGDEENAFRILCDRYWEPLYKTALYRLGNSADAEDAVQEVFISLWRNRNTIEIKQTLSPYLFSALKYCIIKKIYRKARKGLHTPLSVDEINCGDSSEEIFRYKELQQIIGKEVSELPERMQQIYRLSREENFSSREISQRLLISEQTVKNTLSVALKKLRIKLFHFLH